MPTHHVSSRFILAAVLASVAFAGCQRAAPTAMPATDGVPSPAAVADALKNADGDGMMRLRAVAQQLAPRPPGPETQRPDEKRAPASARGQPNYALFAFAQALDGSPRAQEQFARNALDLLDRYKAERVSAAIWQGEREPEFEECVAIGLAAENGSNPEWFCSGVLVSPNVVLTASHCSCKEEGVPATRWWVKFGPTIHGASAPVQVAQVFDYWKEHDMVPPKCPDGRNRCDLRVLVLSRPIDDITPASLASTLLIDQMKDVTIVGYGRSQVEDFGVKRRAVVPIATHSCSEAGTSDLGCFSGEEFVASDPDAQLDSCRGDSGGAAFSNPLPSQLPRMIAGIIVSRTFVPGANCGPGGIYLRLDGDRAIWVDQKVADAAP